MTTLLTGVNDVLRDVGVVHGTSGALASLSDGARQGYIDNAVTALNRALEDAYSLTGRQLPQQTATSTVTLVTDDRDYALASDLAVLLWPLTDETNGHRIYQYPGEDPYWEMRRAQRQPGNWTGRPTHAAVSPEDGELYMNRIPQSDDNGLVFTYHYEKDVSMSAATDTFPCTDPAYRAVVQAASEEWKRLRRRDYDEKAYRDGLARAARLMRQVPMSETWGPRRWPGPDNTDGIPDPFRSQ